MRLLAGDIGATKTRLAWFDTADGPLEPIAETRFRSLDYASLEEIVEPFVAAGPVPPERAAFGVPGPVRHGRAEVTNLPWLVDGARLAEALGLPTVTLVNDLEAAAYGIAALPSHDFVVLNPGAADAVGNAAVIAAGTGLGEAGLYWDGRRHHPFACEGGYTDFAPRTELERALLVYLLERYDHVSYERIVSGPGLLNVYRFLRDTGRGEEPAWLAAELQQGDPAVAISRAAIEGASPLCAQALDLFVTIYGAEAGNLALKVMASGGVYIGGGIAPKMLGRLTDGAFLEAFVAKGRLRHLLEAMPVRIILNDRAALVGAARAALLQPTG